MDEHLIELLRDIVNLIDCSIEDKDVVRRNIDKLKDAVDKN